MQGVRACYLEKLKINGYAENILNDVVEYKKLITVPNQRYRNNFERYQEYKKNNFFTIQPSIKKRVLYLPPVNFTISADWEKGSARQGAFIDLSTGLSTRVADRYRTFDSYKEGKRIGSSSSWFNYHGVTDIWDIPANKEVTVTIRAEHDNNYIDGSFIFLILS